MKLPITRATQIKTSIRDLPAHIKVFTVVVHFVLHIYRPTSLTEHQLVKRLSIDLDQLVVFARDPLEPKTRIEVF